MKLNPPNSKLLLKFKKVNEIPFTKIAEKCAFKMIKKAAD